MWKANAKRAALIAGTIVAVVALLAVLLWRDRPSLDAIDWPAPAIASTASNDSVTVTWLGVTTLLFDDGETQILIDGFFSRPTLADLIFGRAVDNNAAQIDYAMNEFRMRRLAAIIPVHSHFDHAMDIGAIANRCSATIVGSESTAQIARGAGVPDDQIQVVAGKAEVEFGNFKVTLLPSPHAPVGWRGTVPFAGTIDAPLKTPQPVSAWRMGGSYSIVIEHPLGTTLVQGSAGYSDGALQDIAADIVMLGVGQLRSMGEAYAENYWLNTVTATGARSVYPIHFDDYTKPFGKIVLGPKILGSFETTSKWLEQFRDKWDMDTALFMPEFGKPVAIYRQPAAES